MPTLAPLISTAICKAVAAAVREDGAPLSAWPEQYPGPWTIAARVAELLGQSTPQVNHALRELVDAGEVMIAQPWPCDLRGYQPGDRWRKEVPLFALPDEIADKRRWFLDELARWASLHNGRAPRQIDWSKARDPHRDWPRWNHVADLFGAAALEKHIRYFVEQRCPQPCACSSGRHYANSDGDVLCDGCFDCLGRCPHGTVGRWVGPSGWQYALQVAGLTPQPPNS